MINDKIESKYRELSIKYKTKVFYYYDNLLKKVFKNNGANHFEKKPTSLMKMQNIIENFMKKN